MSRNDLTGGDIAQGKLRRPGALLPGVDCIAFLPGRWSRGGRPALVLWIYRVGGPNGLRWLVDFKYYTPLQPPAPEDEERG